MGNLLRPFLSRQNIFVSSVICLVNFIFFCLISKISNEKGKGNTIDSNPMNPPIPYFDKMPLIDTQYKIAKTQSEFDLYELHNLGK